MVFAITLTTNQTNSIMKKMKALTNQEKMEIHKWFNKIDEIVANKKAGKSSKSKKEKSLKEA